MAQSRSRVLPVLAAISILSSAFAKSPEDFVGPAPAQAQPAPPQTQTPPAKATAKPAAAPAPAGTPAAKPAAAKTVAAKPVLDTASLHATYLDGDFDKAIRTMEGALRGKKPITHADSVFIFKHLGVMYAATPSTREKGRYYMLQLISIEPTAKILDMYASDMIYLIFRNVQEEYETKHGVPAEAQPAVDTVPKPQPQAVAQQPAPAPAVRPEGRNKTLYWVAGGTAVAVGTAALVYILLDSPQPKKHDIPINE